MDFTITLEYIEDYLPTPRHRRKQQRLVHKRVDVSIPSLTDQDAPVALTVYFSVSEGTDLRWYRESLWMSFESPKRPMKEADLPAEFTREANNGSHYQREDVADEIVRRRTGEYIIVNGVVYRPCKEPYYVVYRLGFDKTYFCVQNTTEPRKNGVAFNALEYEAAAAYINHSNKGCEEASPAKQLITVHMPEAVRLNPLRDLTDRLRQAIAAHIQKIMPHYYESLPLALFALVEDAVMNERLAFYRTFHTTSIESAFERLLAQALFIEAGQTEEADDEQ